MAKRILQDMVKAGRELPPSFKEKLRKEASETVSEKKEYRFKIYFLALVSVVVLLFALSYLFSGAKVVLVPKTKEVKVSENLSAAKNATNGNLSFDLVVISGEENKSVQGGEEKDVAIKSTGTVIIYNTYNSLSQNLDIDTRLEGSNGKIYKTARKVTVPGMKGNTPGSVEVGIYGAEAGPEYNSGPLDFKIFGFKGTSKYEKFYARSKGEIAGGFKGKSTVLSSLDKASAVSELKGVLQEKLLQKISDQIPAGFVLFKNAVILDISENNVSVLSNEDGTATISLKGTLYGFLFDEKKLTKKIAEDVIDGYAGEDIYISNFKDLEFSISDRGSISLADAKNVSFTLSGSPKFIWRVDEEKFANEIINKKKTDFPQILSKYTNIDSAEITLRPFWKSSFPEESQDIQVVVEYP